MRPQKFFFKILKFFFSMFTRVSADFDLFCLTLFKKTPFLSFFFIIFAEVLHDSQSSVKLAYAHRPRESMETERASGPILKAMGLPESTDVGL